MDKVMSNIHVVLMTQDEALAKKIIQDFTDTDRVSYSIDRVVSTAEAISALPDESCNVYLLDIDSNSHVINLIRKYASQRCLIIMTQQPHEEAESFMIRYGADDYLVKSDISFDLIHRVIQFSIQRKQLTGSFLGEKQRLEAVTGIMTTFLMTNDWMSVGTQVLQQALMTISGDAGFVAVINDRDKCSIVSTYPENSWQADGEIIVPGVVKDLDYDELNDPLMLSIKESLPLVTQNPKEDAFKTLTVSSDKKIDNFLYLPLSNQSEIVGFIGLCRHDMPFTGKENLKLFTILQTSGVVFDIYRRQQKQELLEDQLRRSQKMESVGRLAGGVAHDFNNLLTVINGYTEILLENKHAKKHYDRELSEILKAGKNAAQLTRQLLAFGRRQVFSPSMINVNSIFKNLNTMFRHMLKDDVVVEIDLDDKLGNAYVDVSQIEQVIANLIINSQDAMLQGGILSIVTKNVTVDEIHTSSNFVVPKGEYISFSISDTGCGINEKNIHNIFEPFFTTKEIGRGTGLGLAMVYGIVKQSNGYIVADSVCDRGTTMTLYFPRAIKNVESDVATNNIKKNVDMGVVLVVDDDREVLALAGKVLRDKGYKIIEAYNPGEACFIAEKNNVSIDLLLTDVVMPDMNGHELSQRIQNKIPEMKTIYMSGCSEIDVNEYGINSMKHNFIQKPFYIAELAEIVEQVLNIN